MVKFSHLPGGGGDVPSRWSRARPRPATRTLAAADDDDFADLIEGTWETSSGYMINVNNILSCLDVMASVGGKDLANYEYLQMVFYLFFCVHEYSSSDLGSGNSILLMLLGFFDNW